MSEVPQPIPLSLLRRFLDRARMLTQRQIGRDFMLTAGANFVIAALSAVGGILAARLLGPEGRGELAAAVVWAAILSVVASLGLPQALTYFVAREPDAVGEVFHTSIVILGVQSIAIIGIGWVIMGAVLGEAQPQALAGARLYLWSIPCTTLITYLSTMAQGLKRFKLVNVLRVCAASIYVVALLVVEARKREQAIEVVSTMLLLQMGVAVGGLIFFWFRIKPDGRFQSLRARQLLGYGLRSYWGSLSWMANARLDQFIMSAFVGLQDLGQYAVAVSYATVLFPLSGAFAMILYPRAAASDSGTALRQIMRTFKTNLLVSSVGAGLLAVICPVLLPILFGADFQPATLPAVILLVGTVFLGCNYVLSDGLRGLGHPMVPSIGEAIGMGVTIGGLLILLPLMGIIGAGIVSVASYGMVLIVLLIALKRYLPSRSS